MRAQIVILNYNGYDLLRQCLPSVVEAAARSRHAVTVVVLDNCSTQQASESAAFVRGLDAEIRRKCAGTTSVWWEAAPANDILCSYNDFARRADEDILIFLNNDIRVEPDFVDPLLDVFEKHSDAFFAASKVINVHTQKYEGGRAKLEFRHGLPWGSCRYPGHESKIDQPGWTMQTGFGAFHRKRFLDLAGYDDIYRPGTVEDMDLCFRGYRQGWRGYYCPASVVHHIGQASFKKEFGSARIERMNRRNLHLFVWKNIRDPWLLISYAVWLPIRLLADLMRGRWHCLASLGDAMDRWQKWAGPAEDIPGKWGHSSIRYRKKIEPQKHLLKEREVFAISRPL